MDCILQQTARRSTPDGSRASMRRSGARKALILPAPYKSNMNGSTTDCIFYATRHTNSLWCFSGTNTVEHKSPHTIELVENLANHHEDVLNAVEILAVDVDTMTAKTNSASMRNMGLCRSYRRGRLKKIYADKCYDARHNLYFAHKRCDLPSATI